MWTDDVRIYSLDEHRFLTSDEVEAAREAAYQEQVRKYEESVRK